MATAIWNGTILAEAPIEQCEQIEGNIYFPPGAVKRDHFRDSATHTTCPWKGLASYYDVIVDGQVNTDAAWYYPQPKDAAKQIANFVAFWRGVKVQE